MSITTDKKTVNTNSLASSGIVFTWNPASITVMEYIALYPNGDSDEVRYKTEQAAYNSLCDCDDIVERCRKEFGSCLEEVEEADTISANVRAWADQLGYRILKVLEVKR